MIRQRVALRRPAWTTIARLVTIVFVVAFAYAGAMVVLLAVKVSPRTVNQISDYQVVYRDAVALRAGDFTTAVSLIAGFGGLLVFVLFALITLRVLPRPYLERTRVALAPTGRGTTTLRPRALERVAEYAAGAHPNVASAAGRLGSDELHVDVDVRTADEAAPTLADVRRRVAEQLARHDLPKMPVNVTLTGFQRPTTRESP